jgi:hypothetical protein
MISFRKYDTGRSRLSMPMFRASPMVGGRRDEARRKPQSALCSDMLDPRCRGLPPIAGDAPRHDYRLVGRALKPGSRSYTWTIVREEKPSVPIMQSLVTFRSLADAHVAGSAALDKFRTHQALSAKR